MFQFPAKKLGIALLLILGLVLALGATGCGDDDDDDDSTGDLPVVDDDDDSTDDDDTTDDDDDDVVDDDDDITDDDDDVTDDDDDVTDDDDDTTADAVSIEILQGEELIPVGTTSQYVAEVTYDDDSVVENPAEVVWELVDGTLGSVTGGLVTGTAEGTTYLVASIGSAKLADVVPVHFGPDMFANDMFTGTLIAADRGAGTYNSSYTGSALSVVPSDIFMDDGLIYIIDSGDFGTGLTGQEKVVILDPVTKASRNIYVAVDSPWSATLYDGYIYVTGNLDDQLAVIAPDDSVTYVDLPVDCVPGKLDGANGKIYIACTGFDVGTFTYGNTVAVYDPNAKVLPPSLPTITLGHGENPSSVIATEDEAYVYVLATGDYATTYGALNKIDTSDDSIANSFDIGGSLGEAALLENGQLLVLDDVNLYVIDTTDNDAVLRGELNPVVVGSSGSWLSGIGSLWDTGQIIVADQNFTTFVNTLWVLDGGDYSVASSIDVSATFSAPGNIVTW